MRVSKSFVFLSMLLVVCAAASSGGRIFAAEPDALATQTPVDVAGLKALETQVKSVVAKALPTVVGIRIANAWGSGVIVSEDGIVMTAGHVVDKPGQPVTFFFADGKQAKGKALGDFVSVDAGLMKITDPGKWPSAPMGQSASLKKGEWCIAIGHPLGYRPGRPPVVRVGRILSISEDVVRTDCPLVGGDSGGPLLDLAGNVIGINSRIAKAADVNLHVPVDIFRANWDRLLQGDLWRTTRPSREGPDVKAAFRELVQSANRCVVRIRCGGRDAALGTIVGPDGWVLTKASEVVNSAGDPKARITCRLRDGREIEARVVGVLNPPFTPPLDLAMLKIDATHLPIIQWKTGQPAVGDWLASAGMGDVPLALGIVSVPRRAIPPVSGTMGVQFSENSGPATVVRVLPKSPASDAGLKSGDVITHLNAEAAANTAALRKLLQRCKVGETIKLSVHRGEQRLDLVVRLGALVSAGSKKRQAMNSLGVGVNARSDDFPAVIQHDTVLRPADCGGPVIDLSGQVVGINIAHGGRTETYCLPADILVGPMYELMSGRLSPAILKAAREKLAAENKAAAEKAAAALKEAAEKSAAKKTPAKELPADKKPAQKAPAQKSPTDGASGEKKSADRP